LYCMTCGTCLPDEASYCWKCGKAQVRPDGSPSETAATPGAESQPTNSQPGTPVPVTPQPVPAVAATRGKPIGRRTTESSDASLQALASPPEGGIVGGRSDALAEQDEGRTNRKSIPKRGRAISEGKWVVCSGCHRAYLATEFRELGYGGYVRICPYPNCNSLAGSAFPWGEVRATCTLYPRIPLRYVPYWFSEADLAAPRVPVSSRTAQAGTVNRVPIASSAPTPSAVAKVSQPAVADVTWTETEGSGEISATMMFFGLLMLFTVALVIVANPFAGLETATIPDVRVPIGGLIFGAWLTWRTLRWVEPRNGKVLTAAFLALMWTAPVWVAIRLITLLSR
jgi:hypothetical protein